MITTAEYLREKARADAAEAKVAELQREIQKMSGYTDCAPEETLDVLVTRPESEDAPE